MNLSGYDRKHVRITDIYGSTFTGIAYYCGSEYTMHEYGEEEESLIISDCLILKSQISSIEEIAVHGTAELWTDRLTLRRYHPDDASILYRTLGTDPEMVRYSGWNPYTSPEMAEETVRHFIDGYANEHMYSWVIDCDDVLFGTIGAYDYHDDRIEVGFSIISTCRGRGYATEALKTVLVYLTENEGISCITAWCAAENTGSRRVLEKAGMRLTGIQKGGLEIGDKTYDKLTFEYVRHI